MPMMYNPITDNFTTYEAVETPKVEINFPLEDSPLDISDWSIGLASNGTPIVKPENSVNVPKMIWNKESSPEVIDSLPEDVESQEWSPVKFNEKSGKKETQAYQFFINNGFSPHAAAGIVGNLIQESGLNTIIHGDGGKSIGIAQWNGSRRKNLLKFANSKGKDISDFLTQLEFILYELNSPEYKKALNGLLSAKSVKDATKTFMDHYEKPGDPKFEKRLNFAKSLLK